MLQHIHSSIPRASYLLATVREEVGKVLADYLGEQEYVGRAGQGDTVYMSVQTHLLGGPEGQCSYLTFSCLGQVATLHMGLDPQGFFLQLR